MNLLIASSSDPYQNLATEEYLLKSSVEDYIFLYANKPCVVVGKHQIAQKETNSGFIHENNILIARRLSGGGAVFHDDGNLNFSFIRSVAFGENISYQSITQSIFAFLKQMVPSISLSEKNDFMLEGCKISGSAMHVFKNRVLAHCTLLIDCNLNNLSSSLRGNQDRFKDKSIASVRSKVANLSSALENTSVQSITIDFAGYLKSNFSNLNMLSLSEEAHLRIGQLAAEKYSTFEWIFGYSPKYAYSSEIQYDKIRLHYTLEVEKGIIDSIKIESNDTLSSCILFKLNSLEDQPHNIYALTKWLNAPGCTLFDLYLLNSLF